MCTRASRVQYDSMAIIAAARCALEQVRYSRTRSCRMLNARFTNFCLLPPLGCLFVRSIHAWAQRTRP